MPNDNKILLYGTLQKYSVALAEVWFPLANRKAIDDDSEPGEVPEKWKNFPWKKCVLLVTASCYRGGLTVLSNNDLLCYLEQLGVL